MDSVDWKSVEMVPSLSSSLLSNYETSFFQNTQMLHDCAAVKLGQEFA